jgi:hypothetical protein
LSTHARGQDVGGDLGELQRRQRRRLGGLDDDRVPTRQRRADLPDRHHQRVVPRCDLPDDADWLAADERRVALEVLAGRGSLHRPRRAREEPQAVAHHRDLVGPERLDRLTGVVDLELGELVGVPLERVGESEEHRRPIGGRGLAEGGEGVARALEGAVDVPCGGERLVRDRLPGGGVDDR